MNTGLLHTDLRLLNTFKSFFFFAIASHTLHDDVTSEEPKDVSLPLRSLGYCDCTLAQAPSEFAI